MVFSGMMTGFPTMAITEAIEAASPSMWTVMAAPWCFKALKMAMPSKTSPPGELM
ncbi:Uncharacterised protein [Ewingella americana]|uniref:Uncharacterized protein n=1 Tax=Ewingella americana TaxID=41202 RepID=A0A377TF51_9GAMM|nr:Uncharacterised protein [Ewingella americana]